MSLNLEEARMEQLEKRKIRIKEHLNTNSEQFHLLDVSESSKVSRYDFSIILSKQSSIRKAITKDRTQQAVPTNITVMIAVALLWTEITHQLFSYIRLKKANYEVTKYSLAWVVLHLDRVVLGCYNLKCCRLTKHPNNLACWSWTATDSVTKHPLNRKAALESKTIIMPHESC